uniref:CIDE-N domain-containing protein n=1 Tax=Amblyomma triste TaxID=251400 RepID=A0A023G738_AMBTT
MTTEDLAGKPHKVWSCDRQTRKSVVASSLDELRTKGAAKLGYTNPFDLKIVLETDGTEVEDENYFQRAERDTVFLMLQPNEKWLPPGVEALRAGCDVVDSSEETSSIFSSECLDPAVLLRHLEADTGKLALFTEDQLEVLADMPADSVDPDLFNTTFVETVMDTCGRLLVRKERHGKPSSSSKFSRRIARAARMTLMAHNLAQTLLMKHLAASTAGKPVNTVKHRVSCSIHLSKCDRIMHSCVCLSHGVLLLNKMCLFFHEHTVKRPKRDDTS